MSASEPQDPIQEAREPTEEELRAAYEAQVKKLRVEHVVLENVVTLANLGMRRTGLAPGTEDERDLGQVRMAIESIRVLLPMVEEAAPQQVGAIRDALSQLQLAFVRIGGQPGAGNGPGGAGSGSETEGGEPGSGGSGPGGSGPGAAGSGGAGSGSGGAGSGPSGEPPGAGAPGAKRDEPGPAQRSGRLWVPGQ
ncbi:MAG TPA: hypothetical protein VKR21_17955 [Solirubrobacteraceae bacterium]|nr:hypothetical protein [Solirubrobacteraceae bacterium]